jgi:S1-C subfamily serine protease
VGWIDLVLAVIVVLAVVNGLRLGATIQVFSFLGFWIGLAIGVSIALAVARPLVAGWGRIALTLVLVLGVAALAGAVGGVLGRWTAVALKRWHLGAIDSIVGAVIGAISVLLCAWLIAGFIVQAQAGWLTEAVSRSAVLRTVDSIMPPIPSALAEVQDLLSQEGFPTVFASMIPPQASPSLEPTPASAAAIARTSIASVVKVFGEGCGGSVEGSGFVAAPGEVVTNAHVIAGIKAPEIIIGDQGYPAIPVVVDANLDIAVLKTSAPLGPPLDLQTQIAPRGTPVAVVGYPENGGLHVSQAAISASFEAIGRNIYGGGLVTRQVYELSATVLPGNSGGPVIGPGGRVLGVVFSRSTVDADVGYALTASAVSGSIAAGAMRTAAVSTGSCAPG